MTWLALGGAAVILVLLLMRVFAAAEVATVKKALAWSAGGLGLVLLAALLLSGRAVQALWMLALFAPLLWRWWQARRAARSFAGGASGRAGAGGGAETTVETATLTMTLHHDSGRMTGRVRRGPFAGAELAELGLPDLIALLAECGTADPESVPLLEAWLDRSQPDWRTAAAAAAGPPPGDRGAADGGGGGGAMSRAEALAVLGLGEGATEEEIRAAHRRLMQGAHPDRGGSAWLAARLNEARDRLLRR